MNNNTIPVEALPEAATKTLGIDVSKWQVDIDWQRVRDAGYQFAMIRASVGDRYDLRFVDHWYGAERAQMVISTYHFFERGCGSAFEQAQVYYRSIKRMWRRTGSLYNDEYLEGSLYTPMLPPVLDIEHEEGKSTNPSAEELLDFLEYMEQATEMCPWIYTCIGWWAQAIGNDPRFARFPLWAADYTPPLDIPKPWTDVVMWQTSSRAKVPGIDGNVDVNTFYGSPATLRWMAR